MCVCMFACDTSCVCVWYLLCACVILVVCVCDTCCTCVILAVCVWSCLHLAESTFLSDQCHRDQTRKVQHGWSSSSWHSTPPAFARSVQREKISVWIQHLSSELKIYLIGIQCFKESWFRASRWMKNPMVVVILQHHGVTYKVCQIKHSCTTFDSQSKDTF